MSPEILVECNTERNVSFFKAMRRNKRVKFAVYLVLYPCLDEMKLAR